MHVEKVSFKPTVNLELGFERTVIWGGKNHVPITIGSFLKRFFSFQDVSAAEKLSRGDPGARFAPLIVPIVYLTCASGCLTPGPEIFLRFCRGVRESVGSDRPWVEYRRGENGGSLLQHVFLARSLARVVTVQGTERNPSTYRFQMDSNLRAAPAIT